MSADEVVETVKVISDDSSTAVVVESDTDDSKVIPVDVDDDNTTLKTDGAEGRSKQELRL